MIQISMPVPGRVFRVYSDNWQQVSTCWFSGVAFDFVFFLFLTQIFCIIGIEGFTAIDTIDPMKLNRIKIFQGEGPVSINSSLSKASVTGFANTEVLQSK